MNKFSFIILFLSGIAIGQNVGSYRVKTMLYISPGSGSYGDGCRNDININLVYNDGIVPSINEDLKNIPEGQNSYYENTVDVLATRIPIKIQVKSSRNWNRLIGGCGGNGSFNDDLREGNLIYCTNNYIDIANWWNDQLSITNVPLLKIKDPGTNNIIPINDYMFNDTLVIESDTGFDVSEYNWQYSLDLINWIAMPQFNGLSKLTISATDILGSANIDTYKDKIISLRQKACSVYSNTISLVIKKYSAADQAKIDNLANGSFIPEAGKYIVSGWVKENVVQQEITYSESDITISIANNNAAPFYSETFKPSGAIIDGWQRILGIIEIPETNAQDKAMLQVALNCASTTADCYFDDIRFFPYDGNLKSFVYDEDSQRLMAELDENNYATFYEYDLEGGLVRVKKETEKGVYTIQETRSNSSKAH
jgi:hypothetical protein